MESGREAAHRDVASLLAAKDEENAALRGEIAAVRNENAALLARVTQLECLVALLPSSCPSTTPTAGRSDRGADGVAGRAVRLRRPAGRAAFRPGPARLGSATSPPATFVVFDLLTRYGTDLHDPQHEPP